MEQDQGQEALRLLQDAYESTRQHFQDTRKGYLERLEQLRHDLDATIEASSHGLEEEHPQERSFYTLMDQLRSFISAKIPGDTTVSEGRLADMEAELYRAKDALSSSEIRVKELQEQLRAGVSQNLNAYIDNLKAHIEKKNEIIDVARKRILRLQQKIEGMAYERTEAMQNAADLTMKVSIKHEALQEKEVLLAELKRILALKMGCMTAVNAHLEAVERQLALLKQQHSQAQPPPKNDTTKPEQEDVPSSDEFARKQEELDDANTLLELMQVDLNTLQDKLQEEEKLKVSLKAELETANAEIDRHSGILQEKEQEIQGIRKEMEALEQQAAQFQLERNNCQKTLEREKAEALKFKESAEKAAATIGAYTATLQEKDTSIQNLLHEKDTLNTAIKRLQAEVNEQEDKLNAGQASDQKKTALIKSLTLEIQKVKNLDEQHQRELTKLKAMLEEREQTRGQNTEAAPSDNSAVEEERLRTQEQQQRAEAFRLSLDQANKRLSALENKVRERDATVTLLQEQYQEKDALFKQLSHQAHTSKEQVESLTRALESERSKMLQTEEALKEALANVNSTQNTVQTAKYEADEARTTMNSLAADLQRMQQEAVLLKEQKQSTENKLKRIQEAFNQKSEEAETLVSRLEISEEERQEAGLAVSEMRVEIEKLRETVYEALSEKDTALTQVKDLMNKLTALENAAKKSSSSRKLAALQQQLEAERRRANMIQKLLDESLSSGSKAKLTQQLDEMRVKYQSVKEQLLKLQSQGNKEGDK